MIKGPIKIILFSTFYLLIVWPGTCFGWRYYGEYGDNYWYYHGSGRDYPYSLYIDDYYNPRYVRYVTLGPGLINEPLAPLTQINAPPVAFPEQFTVNIPNKDGSYTAVVIRKSGNGFVGPQGEFYPEFPKVFQLEIMYGK